jgi:hypothetical protein
MFEETTVRRRLYFVLPDMHSARRTVDDLLLARINHRNMHFLASRGTDLGELREANVLQKSDLVHGAELGMIIGGVGGIVIGLMIVLTPPEGVDMHMITVLISSIAGALLGAWGASLIAASTPNSKLRDFEKDMAAGRLLMMVDVPASRVDEVRALVQRRHPEAMGGRVEPTMPAFP